MPVNKDAMARYRIIDRMLADPHRDYTTEQIKEAVNLECPHVSRRMIQKDIKTLEEEFGKEMVRNAGGRGTVRYADQSDPLFYQELTSDEEEILREALRSLGQFEGLDNFTWLDLLKKKLEIKDVPSQRPVICFSKNEGLQMPDTLLGRLFSAITRRKVIRFTYTVLGQGPRQYTVNPYQLKQYNDRWYLLCNPVGDEIYPFRPDFIANFALDRMAPDFEYMDDIPFAETPVDLKTRFDEIIGVTLDMREEIDEIVFAVHPASADYVRTKFLHITQMEMDQDRASHWRKRLPTLEGWSFFSIECRPNYELYSRFCSFGGRIVVLSPDRVRDTLAARFREAADNYALVSSAL